MAGPTGVRRRGLYRAESGDLRLGSHHNNDGPAHPQSWETCPTPRSGPELPPAAGVWCSTQVSAQVSSADDAGAECRPVGGQHRSGCAI
jgi:hypothetical protein